MQPSNTESNPEEGCPFHSTGKPSSAYSVIDALNGFVRYARRSETLNGGILARAVPCKPFTDGNKTGLHFWFSQPVVLSRDEANPALQMTDELFELVNGNYEAKLAELITRGLLVENGYWHQRLSAGAVIRTDGTVSVWTGLLMKPSAGLWLLLTGSYNRGVRVDLQESVIASSEGYTPLVLEFKLDTMHKDTIWLEAELACLVPLQPGVSYTRYSIRERQELGVLHNEFYSNKYLETRSDGKAVGSYRRLLNQAGLATAAGPAVCDLVHIAGPDVHTIETFQRLFGPQGPLPADIAADLPFVVLRNFTPLEFDFDGVQSHLNNEDMNSHGEELLSTWKELYGEQSLSAVDWWANYFIPNVAELVGEPQVMIIPYAFLKTPQGWSTLSDGFSYRGLLGLRGVIGTDFFHHAGPIFQYQFPGDFRLETGDPLMRLLPVPRKLLEAPFEVVELSSVSAASC